MSAFRFTALDQDLVQVASAETRREMLARSGGARGTLEGHEWGTSGHLWRAQPARANPSSGQAGSRDGVWLV